MFNNNQSVFLILIYIFLKFQSVKNNDIYYSRVVASKLIWSAGRFVL